jgi:hypothetical protein
MESKTKTLKIHPADNLMVALVDLQTGETVNHGTEIFQLQTAEPAKHKFALEAFSAAIEVLLYGVVVGHTTKNIAKGVALLNYIIDVASGKGEVHARRLGQDDFIPWKRGMTF